MCMTIVYAGVIINTIKLMTIYIVIYRHLNFITLLYDVFYCIISQINKNCHINVSIHPYRTFFNLLCELVSYTTDMIMLVCLLHVLTR